MKCFWPNGCANSARCCEFGSCVAAHQNKHKHEISRPAPQVVGGELLPCPFCGVQPIMRADGETVYCPTRKCLMSPGYSQIKDWNTRPTATQGELVGLRDALTWVLPMAKGYAALNKTGNNAQIISMAEAALSASPVAGWIAVPYTDLRKLVLMVRTSGGTAGRDEELCSAIEAIEKLLPDPTR